MKVSLDQFVEDFWNCYDEWKLKPTFGFKDLNNSDVVKMYNDIQLPRRGTRISAGYDFFFPHDLQISAGQLIKIPSGIRWRGSFGRFASHIQNKIVLSLLLMPRSSYVLKGVTLGNSVFMIDADYFRAKNQGDIMVFLKNTSNSMQTIKAQTGYMQGTIVPAFLVDGDSYNNEDLPERTGGIGSTTKE
jgi:dUTP pyrophosphatase